MILIDIQWFWTALILIQNKAFLRYWSEKYDTVKKVFAEKLYCQLNFKTTPPWVLRVFITARYHR